MPFCDSLMRDRIKDVIEFPRDHFKTTVCTEGLPMWWALPLTQQDLDEFYQLGYNDEFIRFMRRVHDPCTTTLIGSENLTNAVKLGNRTRWHFESNSRYRALFPETLPTSSEIWSAISLHVKRPGIGGSRGEGTFDFVGVGGAIQSRHYNRLIEDDLVGRKAIESRSIMDKTKEYHRLLVGAFESDNATHENDELIIGNRWGFSDLNSDIRENEPWFRFETHSALGGCCPQHPDGVPIFPEEFSVEKLAKFKKRLGPYNFSCQFLNNPIAPEDADFKEEWLHYYDTYQDANHFTKIKHEVTDGQVKADLSVRMLETTIAVDPNHSGNAGRCRHAIIVAGLSGEGDYYLLDYWAKSASYDSFFDNLYLIARKWDIRRIGFETVAAQKYAKYHIQQRNRCEPNPLTIVDLKGEVENPDGSTSRNKEWRIRNVLEPIFSRGQFYCQRRHQDFIQEYRRFPAKDATVDILDALAYTPQLLRYSLPYDRYMTLLNRNRAGAAELSKPYAVVGVS
jgi:hypothetical protein